MNNNFGVKNELPKIDEFKRLQIAAQERGLETIKRVTEEWQERIKYLKEKIVSLENKLMPEQADRVRLLHTENLKLSLDIQCLSNLLDIQNDEHNRRMAMNNLVQHHQAPQPYAYPPIHYQNQLPISAGTASPNMLSATSCAPFPLSQSNPGYIGQGPGALQVSPTRSPSPSNFSPRTSGSVLNRMLPGRNQVWPRIVPPLGFPLSDHVNLGRAMPALPRSQSEQPNCSAQPAGTSSDLAQQDDEYGVWKCSHCTFDNFSALQVCEICDRPRCQTLGNTIQSIYSHSKRIISTAAKKHKYSHRRGSHHHQDRGDGCDKVKRSHSNETTDNESRRHGSH